jgi:uridine kinase
MRLQANICHCRVKDSFYKQHGPEEVALAHASLFDFDHPDAIDMEKYASVL